MGDYEYETDSGCLSVKVHLRDPEEGEDEAGGPTPLLPYLGVKEVSSRKVMNCLLAEFTGTLFLVLVGCGSCTGGDRFDAQVQLDDQANIVRISLCFGIVVASLAQALGHISGCHINPAVTLGLITARKIGIIKGILYMMAQCLGGIAGAAILYGIVPGSLRGANGLGQTTLNPQISTGNGVAVEMLISCVLVLVVFGSAADTMNSVNVKGSPPLAIGLSITACHLWAIPLTGSSMNPARTLGPAVIMKNTENLWVYWVGPLLGGFIAAIIYQIIFRARAEVTGEDKYKVSRTDFRRRLSEYNKKKSPSKDIIAIEERCA